jgi:hypothetical protein
MMKDARKKYISYTVEELLQDDFFIASMTRPDKESDAFWNQALEEGTVNRRDYEVSRYFIHSMQVRPESIESEEVYTLWEDIEVANKSNLKKKRMHSRFYVSAMAGVAVLFVVAFILNDWLKSSPAESCLSSIENIKAPDMPASDIQLVLANDETLSLEGKEAEIAYNEAGIAINNQKMDFNHKPAYPDSPLTFNQLIVPLGKRSMLTFAEGSRMWVNAGTRVVYPTSFDKNRREIYVDGEVYLEVSPDANYPFIVKTKKLNVEVLGTSFNVNAYEKDSIQHIVLVAGTVKIHSANNKNETTLIPNEMYSYINGSSKVKVVNVENYIAWKSGAYQYESETLDVVFKRLARYYGKDIACSPQVAQLKCSGKLDLKDDLELVLKGISKTAPIVYLYNGERYTVTNK